MRRPPSHFSKTQADDFDAHANAEAERRWLEQNRDEIASMNAFINQNGLLASRLRYRPD